MANKLRVGQEVVLRRFGELIPTVVSYVGRKYFKVRDASGVKFFLENLMPSIESYARMKYQVYLSEQDFLTEEERLSLGDKLDKILRRADNVGALRKLSLDKLKKLDICLKEVFE